MGGRGGSKGGGKGKSAATKGFYKGVAYAAGKAGKGRGDLGKAASARQIPRQPVTRFFSGWPLYFRAEDEPDSSDERFKWAHAMLTSLRDEQVAASIGFDPVAAERSGCVILDRKIASAIPGFSEPFNRLDDMPEMVLACLGVAFYECASTSREHNLVNMRKIAVRVQCEVISPIRDIKSQTIGKFVSVCGTVVRVSAIRPLVTSIDFVCDKCGERMPCIFNDGKYATPNSCTGHRCRNQSSFSLDKSSAKTIDWQKIRVQEIDDKREEGRMPRTIECELTDDLVDRCVPGDELKVCGVVKMITTSEMTGRMGGRNKTMFFLYIDANMLVNSKQVSSSKTEVIGFTQRELQAIERIALGEHVLHQLIHSLCPSIFGHHLVKVALLLSLFGGVVKHVGHKSKLPTRGDIHVLLVGDPGMGKSQLLRAVSHLAPRGVYVCGNTATATGLTVTVVKDALTGDFTLEAGALVLGDQGLCCIDEFDKMGGEQAALLEAMEQQSISIAKAGIVCNLSARTSVVAAANPVGGHYDRCKTVTENLKMGGPILSRFDLVFILMDTPDEVHDQMLSSHVMNLHHTGRTVDGQTCAETRLTAAQMFCDMPGLSTDLETSDRASLQDRLSMSHAHGHIPADLLRQYIAYARKYVRPTLSSDAKMVLKQFYLELRRRYHSMDSTPITTRQLEALVRLAEARAKLELREEVTKSDAEDVVEVMQQSLIEVYIDDAGYIDMTKSVTGISSKKMSDKLLKELNRLANRQMDSLFSRSQIQDCWKLVGGTIDKFDSMVSSLNDQGLLLMKGQGFFKLQTYGFDQTASQRRFMG